MTDSVHSINCEERIALIIDVLYTRDMYVSTSPAQYTISVKLEGREAP